MVARERSMELHTDRLVLRDFRPEDVPMVLGYQTHRAYLAFYEGAAPTDGAVRNLVDTFRRWAADEPRTKYQLAITWKGRVIGTCGVRGAGDDEAEFGCEVDPEFCGRGYAREASRAIIDFGFETLRVRRLTACTTSRNVRAIRLAEALGFRQVGEGLYELRRETRAAG
jgi:ribosomal-protein-alanine N-acetyltransferase